MAEESLTRATSNTSLANYQTIFAHFTAQGIEDIRPRENVLTYNAWQALGRQVRKGEHGCAVTTWIVTKKEDPKTGKELTTSRPRHARVFHISQTDPIPGNERDVPAPQTLESLIG